MLHNIVNDYIILEELGDVGLVYVMTIIRFESDGAHNKNNGCPTKTGK